jgi:uncharacterized membrane protein
LSLIALAAVILRSIAIPYFGFGYIKDPVDVYYVDREAAKLILLFRDPYLYADFTNRFGQVVTFSYMPLIPVYFAPFALMGWDIRYGSIIADVVVLVALYFIIRSMADKHERQPVWTPLSGSLAYALLPISILLTSVLATNIMIGIMFLVAGIATLFYNRWTLSGVLFGLALATNQFIIVVLPIVAIYCLRRSNLRPVMVSMLMAGAVVLPFLLYSPSSFLRDVIYFQFQRPLQTNGSWSLYYVIYTLTGYSLGTPFRILIFGLPAGLVTFLFSSSKKRLLIGLAIVLSLATFVLPVDGFWNYFLLPATIVCAIVPIAATSKFIVQASPFPKNALSSSTTITRSKLDSVE